MDSDRERFERALEEHGVFEDGGSRVGLAWNYWQYALATIDRDAIRRVAAPERPDNDAYQRGYRDGERHAFDTAIEAADAVGARQAMLAIREAQAKVER